MTLEVLRFEGLPCCTTYVDTTVGSLMMITKLYKDYRLRLEVDLPA